VVVEKVKTLEAGHGLNAATGEYVDMFAAGIIDPANVTRSARQGPGRQRYQRRHGLLTARDVLAG
jgi:hypothetical protein